MAASGRVVQINVSQGGVPKLPVAEARVGWLGLDGDGHRDRTQHGGPHRAVCLFSIEAIERLQTEGHPVEPGSVGENLTTAGIEWSLLPIGTRARVGDTVLLELASSTTPCSTQRPNFIDGKYSRILIDLHPSDSRMYARVIEEGTVRPGDAIELMPPTADSRAADELLLKDLDYALGKSALAGWREAHAAGMDIDIVVDGELIMAAAPAEPGARYNQALGLARLPNLIPDAQRFFAEHGVVGWIVAEDEPWPGAAADPPLDVFGAAPEEVADVRAPDGVTIHADPRYSGAHEIRLLAEHDGEEVGRAWLYVYHGTGWMRGAFVEPAWRGRGLQRALTGVRARLAEERGAGLVGATAEPGTVSAANLAAAGLRRLGSRSQYRYVPTPIAAAAAGRT